LTIRAARLLYRRPRVFNSATSKTRTMNGASTHVSIRVSMNMDEVMPSEPVNSGIKSRPSSPVTSTNAYLSLPWRHRDSHNPSLTSAAVPFPTYRPTSPVEISSKSHSKDVPTMTLSHFLVDEPVPYSTQCMYHEDGGRTDVPSVVCIVEPIDDDPDSAIEMQQTSEMRSSRPRLSTSNDYSKERKPLEFGPALWRLIWFQFAFSVVEILGSLSTLIDVGEGRKTPTSFGTQHLALICAAWGPCIIWGHLPGTKKILHKWIKHAKTVVCHRDSGTD